MSQKGLAWLPVLLGVVLVIATISVTKNLIEPKIEKTQVYEQTIKEESSSSTEGEDIKEESVKTQETKKPAAASTSCDLQKDLCFEGENVAVTIQEGYLEDADNWISDNVFLVGNGSGGYELKLEGFPKEFSVRSPVQDFKGQKQKIYIRLQKNVTKKGTYKGKVLVKSYITGRTNSANLTVDYTDWSDKSIHADPKEVFHDCKVTYSGWPENKYIKCGEGDYQDVHRVRFYYLGKHSGIEVKSVPEPGSKRSLVLKKELREETTFDVENSVTLYTSLAGFPGNKELVNEPGGTYKGHFVFFEQVSGKELLKVPYTFRITNTN